jgi:CheY-like chemotaxis protein
MQQKSIQELNVLIVDDDRHMRMLIRNVVFALGVKDVMEASDGSAALDELKATRADLVLCDMKMEPMGGLAFVKRLRADPNNPCRFVPVIMITAYAELKTVADARDAGVSEFMAKPISADALNKRIQRVLEDQRHYVEAQDFFGPDRRRSRNDEFGGEDRRQTPPTFLEIPRPSP